MNSCLPRRARRSENYLGLLLKELRGWSLGWELREAASISSAEIEGKLHSQGWSARTMQGRLLTLRTVFAWAIARGELVVNPALGVDLPTDEAEQNPPGIHTPLEATGTGGRRRPA